MNFFTNNQEFYVLFLDPRGIIERLYITSCSDIMHFMKEHINIEYGEGVDIAICTKKIDNALICNHDGQIFLLNELAQERLIGINKIINTGNLGLSDLDIAEALRDDLEYAIGLFK